MNYPNKVNYKVIFFFLLSFSAICNFAEAQDVYAAGATASTYSVADLVQKMDMDLNKVAGNNSAIAGSPYVYNDFQQGRVHSVSANAWFDIELNKNAYSSLFEFKYNGNIYEMPNYIFDSVIINSSVYIPVSIRVKDAVTISSMEIVSSDQNGNFLLKDAVVKFMDRVEEKPYIPAKPAQYKKFPPKYYISLKDAELLPVESLKALCNEDFAPQNLQTYIRRNKIKRRDEGDLKRLFDYMFITSKQK